MACTRKKQCLYGDICPTARSDEYNLTDPSCYKPLEQTNEEWFDALNTKEKAEVISRLSCYHGNVYEIEKWLKQPHTNEETNVN